MIALCEEQGTPVAVSLAVLREALDAKALAYEEHVASLLAQLPCSAT
jgi:hypothetical protein